jgi:hypothetical protein
MRRLWLALMQLQQGYAAGGMGVRVKLHGSNFELTMSHMGQKQTLHAKISMSALLAKADIAERQLDVRFGPEAEMGQAPYFLILDILIPPPKHADHLLM